MECYHPTLWRTCRVLANERRIACLKAVLVKPGGVVGEIAADAHMGEDKASLGLRALQARGLILARRESRWVRYFPEPDPLVPAAASILAGIRHALLCDKLPSHRVLHCVTAFTHPRRVAIIKCLQRQGPVSFDQLAKASRMSPTALYRHLNKLERRQLVREVEKRWTLCHEHEHLADTFLTLIALSPET